MHGGVTWLHPGPGLGVNIHLVTALPSQVPSLPFSLLSLKLHFCNTEDGTQSMQSRPCTPELCPRPSVTHLRNRIHVLRIGRCTDELLAPVHPIWLKLNRHIIHFHWCQPCGGLRQLETVISVLVEFTLAGKGLCESLSLKVAKGTWPRVHQQRTD